jgi:6-pyruvoyltetrahydropterin/6-carboxytetrahydropterin synthase
MIRLTRVYRFCASHRLHSTELSDSDNAGLYGKCNNPYGHGHNYVLEVTAEGPVDAKTGRVCDVATLDALVHQYVLRDLDHRNLNEEAPEFANTVPTSENMALVIDRRLRAGWQPAFAGEWPRLSGIRLRETKRNTFEHRS